MSFFNRVFFKKTQEQKMSESAYKYLKKLATDVYNQEGSHIMTGMLVQTSVVEFAEELKDRFKENSHEFELTNSEIDEIVTKARDKILSELIN